MCSCAFYPLHLVYSGLIWTFGVRVNYISKLFLHFYIHVYIYYILASLISYFFLICKKTLPREVSQFVFVTLGKLKPNENCCVSLFLSGKCQFLPNHIYYITIVAHRTSIHTSRHAFQHVLFMHGCSMTLSLSLSLPTTTITCHGERNVRLYKFM